LLTGAVSVLFTVWFWNLQLSDTRAAEVEAQSGLFSANDSTMVELKNVAFGKLHRSMRGRSKRLLNAEEKG